MVWGRASGARAATVYDARAPSSASASAIRVDTTYACASGSSARGVKRTTTRTTTWATRTTIETFGF
jgi:hypothetical protein